MKKTLVAYYSNKGNNDYLARRTAGELQCDIERIRPRIGAHLLLLFGIHLGNRRMGKDPGDYERVILVGPIWMGKFIPPLRVFVNRYKERIRELVFLTCCGSGFEIKDQKFGHGLVFRKVEEAFGRPVHCRALPITLVLSDEQKKDPNTVMGARLSDSNFKGEIERLFDAFLDEMRT